MKILVIGAAGGTGEEVVQQAMRQGHEVTALVHHAEDARFPSGVRVVTGDVLNPSLLEEVMPGQDAVVDALGGHTPWKATTLETNAARLVIDAMRQNSVQRLLVVSAIGVGETKDLVPGWYEKLILPTVLRGAMHDKEQMEPEIAASGLEWTIVRPGHLVDGERTGIVKTFEPGTGEKAHKITRADLAGFLLDVLAQRSYLRQSVNVASN
jgi:putative NADH-flavin reductase